ncbi:MAG: SufD family Fe-S cluster assembly protein [Candidatus Micrarchaeota archaeon]|nr:SufD family Fe-S cluster assembly protein [Candidatus Micrarchaeota archaeon]MDE1834510.1 SufD family Fe-S cluster assembly protein [Candidatus Micrarchaeota archaeon]MDE1859286.1 SufD family Fe-S cluster assembly protein [Candidatus Micrarchaeota archaeon]
MKTYKEFVEDAIKNYETLPIESNDIYKKYTVNPAFDYIKTDEKTDKGAHEAGLEMISKAVTEKTRIKFDGVISNHAANSFNADIKLTSYDKTDIKLLEGKMFKSNDDKLAAFSNAHANRIIVIDAPENSHKKLNLLFVSNGNLGVQVLVNSKKNSKIEIFELFASGGNSKSIVTVLHEISAGHNSETELNVLHNEGDNAHVLNLCKAIAKDNAKLNANFIYSGGAVTKTKCYADSDGSGSEVDINEFAFGTGNQKFDLGTFIANRKPYSTARLESGAILDGNSHCMLKGYAKVEKGAKGCFSRITERGILLSDNAHIDALPDMAIDYSNEVKATHSAATSPIDKEALFYLESRGLEEKAARKAFIISFITKYISRIKDGVASEVAMSVMLNKLEGGELGTIPEIKTSGIWMSR